VYSSSLLPYSGHAQSCRNLTFATILLRYGDGAGITDEENSQHLLPNPNAIVAVNKSMRAVNVAATKSSHSYLKCQLTRV